MPKTDTSFSTYTSMMRVTSTGRPFTKDLFDMFAAVLLQIQLSDHRVLFRTYPHTFSTDEAAKVMSQLSFIHVHRKPDPMDESRHIATRTTTTFSMDYATAKTLVQQFLSARLIMNATDPANWTVKDKGLWCLTVKGKHVIEAFTEASQVKIHPALKTAFEAVPGGSPLITLDRLADNDDQITFSRPNMTAVFRAMMASLPRESLLLDDIGMEYEYLFLGLTCLDWLCNRLAVNSRNEAETVALQFLLFGWLARVLDPSEKQNTRDETPCFISTRSTFYYVTERGCAILGRDKSTFCTQRPPSMAVISHHHTLVQDSSQRVRLMQILETPLTRMYFRDFLRANYCVENMNFWVDYHQLFKSEKPALEQVADAYALYETYLGPAYDINIDHLLHQEITKYVSTVFLVVHRQPLQTPYFVSHVHYHHLLLLPQATKQKYVMIRGVSPEKCLAKLMALFGRVNDHVCRMMAEDSVPKFIKTPKYKALLHIMTQEEEEEKELEHFSTSFSAQRSSIDHHRHKTAAAM